MPLYFPPLTPNFVDFQFPEYFRSTQEFDTSDYLQQIYQSNAIGLILIGRFEKASLATLNLVRNFYYLASIQSFELSTEFLKNFDPIIKPALVEFPRWKFKEPIKTSPWLINRQNKLYNFGIILENVFS